MKILDITRALAPDLAPWPGDTNFDYRLVGRMIEGSSVNVGRIMTSVHSGTHADAYFHFDDTWPDDRTDLHRNATSARPRSSI